MKPKKIVASEIDKLIIELRDQKVILDSEPARIYGTETFRLNEAVKRNRERFPQDFLFQLTTVRRNRLRHPSRPGRKWVFTSGKPVFRIEFDVEA
jgi:hypothetical protein